jgi:hypothetical protein
VDAMLRSPWILAPFGQERLRVWLPEIAQGAPKPGFVFRQSDNGKFILPPALDGTAALPDQDQPEPAASPNPSNFLKYLAAYSRGIPGVAWALWRRSLYLAMEQEADEKQGGHNNGHPEATGDMKTIWVKPWHQLTWPSIPNLPERPQLLLVLHAVILHGGLWGGIVQEVLPFAPMQVLDYLHLLEASGLVESDQGFWRVPPTAYPAVRQALQSEGYLTDAV